MFKTRLLPLVIFTVFFGSTEAFAASELQQMRAAGAAGEVAGWVFDSDGQYLDFGINTRTGGVRVEPGLDRPSIGIAAGATKVPAIRGALKSRILNGLVTDMPTAEALLSAG